jgi:hypothetical protein
MHLPTNQSQLVAPTSMAKYTALGVGIQNYSCTAGGNYTSIGAVARLYDISPYYKTPVFSMIQEDAYFVWSHDPDTNPLAGLPSNSEFGLVRLLGVHDFVISNGTLSPKFDFTQYTGNSEDFVIAAKTGDILAPSHPDENVDWLELTKVEGGLAQKVFRVDTVAGKPPSTCVPGSGVITVKYAAKYYFF